jgi:hypothetical protein
MTTPGSLTARRILLASSAAVLATGCFSTGRTDATFTGRSPRSEAVLRAAATDLACPLASLHVEAETGRRYISESAFRSVVERCGERAGYVEVCDVVTERASPVGPRSTVRSRAAISSSSVSA